MTKNILNICLFLLLAITFSKNALAVKITKFKLRGEKIEVYDYQIEKCGDWLQAFIRTDVALTKDDGYNVINRDPANFRQILKFAEFGVIDYSDKKRLSMMLTEADFYGYDDLIRHIKKELQRSSVKPILGAVRSVTHKSSSWRCGACHNKWSETINHFEALQALIDHMYIEHGRNNYEVIEGPGSANAYSLFK